MVSKIDVSAIVQDQNGVIWVGTQKYGLYKIKNGETEQILKAGNNKIPNILSLFVDSKNNLWVGTGRTITLKGTGVYKFDGQKWAPITTGFPNNFIMKFYEDSKGDICICSGKGIYKLKSNVS